MAMLNNQMVDVFPVEEPTKKGLKMVKEPFGRNLAKTAVFFRGTSDPMGIAVPSLGGPSVWN